MWESIEKYKNIPHKAGKTLILPCKASKLYGIYRCGQGLKNGGKTRLYLQKAYCQAVHTNSRDDLTATASKLQTGKPGAYGGQFDGRGLLLRGRVFIRGRSLLVVTHNRVGILFVFSVKLQLAKMH